MKLAITLAALCCLLTSCILTSCVTTGSTVSIARPGETAITFTTGKDVQSTAKSAALAAAAWYLQQLTTPAK